jgi:hypothetical protein
MRPNDFDINVIQQALEGACDTLEGALEECYPGMSETDMTIEDHEALDQLIFCCEECGWWYEISENAETDDDSEMICQGCEDAK